MFNRLLLLGGLALLTSGQAVEPIDRRALVTRHNVVRTSVDSLIFHPGEHDGLPHAASPEPKYAPLQVGNGRFALSVDVTGLQTFIPCQTMAQWGWHTEPLPAGRKADDFVWLAFPDGTGRPVPHAWVALSPGDAPADTEVAMSEAQRQLAFWTRANPHLLNLGRVALLLRKADGTSARLEELTDLHQELDLWSGVITSRFAWEGETVLVETRAHPERDAVAVRIRSPLTASGRLAVSLKFPYGDVRKQTADVGDWAQPDRHETRLERLTERHARLWRTLDADRYAVDVSWSAGDGLHVVGPHALELRPTGVADEWSFVVEFTPLTNRPPLLPEIARAPPSEPLEDAAVEAASRAHWPDFWASGAALDLGGTDDPRARELERRVVLSQYLLAVQEAGPLPPQEAGLVNLGWHGKFHLEMYPWHAAHYALWDRWPLLERSLDAYAKLLPTAQALAERQDYLGARWPKMIGPDGVQSPGNVNPFLLWQQPHPLLFAELEWRERPTRTTLERWEEVVGETADFMASVPVRRKGSRHLHLGPPLKTVSENTPAATTWDPAFELSYWRFGLRIAQNWRDRLGILPDRRWAAVLRELAPLPQKDGRYLLSASQPDTYENWHWEHPAVAGVLGLLPGAGADSDTMRRTLQGVMDHWSFERVWGWDFPLLAMCAARLGEPELAVDLLLHRSLNYQFADNGLATGGPWPYFPSNGGLLYAVALMAGGWDGAPADVAAPGFPPQWQVKAEGFRRAP